MVQVMDLDGLPEPVAQAIVEAVLNLKSHYRTKRAETSKPPRDLPSRRWRRRLCQVNDHL